MPIDVLKKYVIIVEYQKLLLGGVIKEGRTLLPLRIICETLGGSVEYIGVI